MGKSPLILAALAKDAVPELDFSRVETMVGDSDSRDFEVALLTSSTGEHYVLREPKNHSGHAKIAIEVAISKALSGIPALSFKVPALLGETRDPRVEKAYLFNYVYGYKIDPHAIAPNSNLPTRIGEVLAEIHNLPASLVEANGLPEYSVAQIVKSRVAELDRAVATGRIPANLANRWEKALEDVAIFRFNPCVVHGDMTGDHILELDDSIESVISWSSLKVSDPADDFAWLMSGTDDDVVYQVLLAYSNRRQISDPNLRVRATLYSEMLVARWLLHGQALGDESIVEEAIDMLNLLSEDVAERRVAALSPAEISSNRSPNSGVSTGESGLVPASSNAFLAASELPTSTESFTSEKFETVSDKTRPIEIIESVELNEEVEIFFSPQSEAAASTGQESESETSDDQSPQSTRKPDSDELF